MRKDSVGSNTLCTALPWIHKYVLRPCEPSRVIRCWSGRTISIWMPLGAAQTARQKVLRRQMLFLGDSRRRRTEKGCGVTYPKRRTCGIMQNSYYLRKFFLSKVRKLRFRLAFCKEHKFLFPPEGRKGHCANTIGWKGDKCHCCTYKQ